MHLKFMPYNRDSLHTNITSPTPSKTSHRKLSSVSVTNSVVSGNGTQNQLVRDNVTVTVVAKDSSGNSITTGGETFVLRVTSKCVAESIHLCSNSYNSPSQYIDKIMTDNNDGTYTYSYSMVFAGNFSVQVLLMTPGEVQDFIKCHNNSIIGNVYLLFYSKSFCLVSANKIQPAMVV